MTIMIRNEAIEFEKIYENVRNIAPIYDGESKIVYGKLNFENGESATFNMDEFDFYDLTPRKIKKFTTNFLYQ